MEMSISELESKVHDLRELRRMAEELQAEIDSIQDEIKDVMKRQGVDTLTGSGWKITWKSIDSSRLDTAALKEALPDVAARFTKPNKTNRFYLL